jgi:hypothetical protein
LLVNITLKRNKKLLAIEVKGNFEKEDIKMLEIERKGYSCIE